MRGSRGLASIAVLLSGLGVVVNSYYSTAVRMLASAVTSYGYVYIAVVLVILVATLIAWLMAGGSPGQGELGLGRILGFLLLLVDSLAVYMVSRILLEWYVTLCMLSLVLLVWGIIALTGGFGDRAFTVAYAASLLLVVPLPLWMLGGSVPILLSYVAPAASLAPGAVALALVRRSGWRGALRGCAMGLGASIPAALLLGSIVGPNGALLAAPLYALIVYLGVPRGSASRVVGGTTAPIGLYAAAWLAAMIVFSVGLGLPAYMEEASREPLTYNLLQELNAHPANASICPAPQAWTISASVGGQRLSGYLEVYRTSLSLQPLRLCLNRSGYDLMSSWSLSGDGAIASFAIAEAPRARFLVGSASYPLTENGTGTGGPLIARLVLVARDPSDPYGEAALMLEVFDRVAGELGAPPLGEGIGRVAVALVALNIVALIYFTLTLIVHTRALRVSRSGTH